MVHVVGLSTCIISRAYIQPLKEKRHVSKLKIVQALNTHSAVPASYKPLYDLNFISICTCSFGIIVHKHTTVHTYVPVVDMGQT